VLALDKGNVRLRKRDELNAKWDPATDRRSSVWESLLAKLGPTRQEQIKELAYRLYTTCDKQGWTTEAQAYDGLVRGWSDIRDRADAAPTAARQTSFAE
jgi:putative DNA methylase